MLKKWIQINNDKLIGITKNITKNHDDTMELYQEVIIQLLQKELLLNELPDINKLYYFIRVTNTNWKSKNSPYRYHRNKYRDNNIEFMDYMAESLSNDEYINPPSMEWVNKKLEGLDWYNRDLFLLYLELGTFTKVSSETTIPINSVHKYIKKTIKYLNDEWNKEK